MGVVVDVLLSFVLSGVQQDFQTDYFWFFDELVTFCEVGVGSVTPEDVVPLIVNEFDASPKYVGVLDPITLSVVTREHFPSCSAHYRWWEVVCVSVDEANCINPSWYL